VHTVLYSLHRLATFFFGKQIFDEKTHPIGSNQCLAVVGNRLLLSPEGQHGTQSLQWVDSENEHKLIGSKWLPPNNSRTAPVWASMQVTIVSE